MGLAATALPQQNAVANQQSINETGVCIVAGAANSSATCHTAGQASARFLLRPAGGDALYEGGGPNSTELGQPTIASARPRLNVSHSADSRK